MLQARILGGGLEQDGAVMPEDAMTVPVEESQLLGFKHRMVFSFTNNFFYQLF